MIRAGSTGSTSVINRLCSTDSGGGRVSGRLIVGGGSLWGCVQVIGREVRLRASDDRAPVSLVEGRVAFRRGAALAVWVEQQDLQAQTVTLVPAAPDLLRWMTLY